MKDRYIKYKTTILSVEGIRYIWYKKSIEKTRVVYKDGGEFEFGGNIVDNLWQLVGLVIKSEDKKQSAIASDLLHVALVVEQPEVQVASEDDIA